MIPKPPFQGLWKPNVNKPSVIKEPDLSVIRKAVIISITPYANVKPTKKQILELVEKDRINQQELKLESGKLQEIGDGVFIKKNKDNNLEFYFSEY